MRGALRLALTLGVVLGAEAAFFSSVGVPDAPGFQAVPQFALTGSALLIILQWSAGRVPGPADTPRWPAKTAGLPLTDPEWDPATAQLVSLFTARRDSIFSPAALAATLTTLMAERTESDATDLPADLRSFLNDPRRMPSTATLTRWLVWIEGRP